MNTLDIIRDYIGQELTTQYVERLATAPAEHITPLIQNLAPHYYDWLEHEETNQVDTQESRYFCIDHFSSSAPWQQQLETFKKHLLYFPRFVIPDPLASFLWPHITFAAMFGTVTINEEFRQNLRNVLLLLSELAPVVDDKDIFLMPTSFAKDYSAIQEGAGKDLQIIEGLESNYYEPLFQLIKSQSTDKEQIRMLEDGVRMIVGSVQVCGQICAKLQLTPVAGDEFVREILKQDYARGLQYILAPNRTQRATQTLLQYEVPGAAKASFERIIALRKNEDAFHEWRREFGKVLDKAQEEGPADEKQFEVEFKDAAQDILSPRVKELEKATASSALEKIFVPASLSIGAGAAAVYVADIVFPPTAIAAASLAPAGWVLDKIIKRFNKSGRKATVLKEFYGYLLDKA